MSDVASVVLFVCRDLVPRVLHVVLDVAEVTRMYDESRRLWHRCGSCSHYVEGFCREPLGMLFDVSSDGNIVYLVCEVDESDYCSNWKAIKGVMK